MKRAESGKSYTLAEVWGPRIRSLPSTTILFPDTNILLLDVVCYEERGGYLTPSGHGGDAKRAHLEWLRQLFREREILIEPLVFKEVSEAYQEGREREGGELLTLLETRIITPWSSQHSWTSDFICTPAAYIHLRRKRENITRKIITQIDEQQEELPTRGRRDRLSPTDLSLLVATITESIEQREKVAILTLDTRVRFIANTFRELAEGYTKMVVKDNKTRSNYQAALEQLDLFAPSPTNKYHRQEQDVLPTPRKTF